MKKCAVFVFLFTCFLLLFAAVSGRSYMAGAQKLFLGMKLKLSEAGQTFDELINKNSLRRENESLRKEISHLKARAVESESLKYENEMLKSALDIKDANISANRINASVVGVNTHGGFFLTVDRGKKQGISKGDVCVFGSALVGKISEVFDSFATVIPITADSCVVGIANSQGDAGVAMGSLPLMAKNMCSVEFFANVQISEGDILVTSGLSDTYPKGLLVGEVCSSDEEILLKTQVDFFKIRTLSVIPSRQEVSREGNKK